MGNNNSKISANNNNIDVEFETELKEFLINTNFEQEEIIKLYINYKEVSKNMQSVDKKKFHQILEKIGLIEQMENLSYQELLPPNNNDEIFKTKLDSSSSSNPPPPESIDSVQLYENAVVKDMVGFLFAMFDENKDNKIDFPEFITGTSILLSGTVEQKSKMVFRYFDADNDGVLTKTELFNSIKNSMKSAKKIKNLSTKQFREVMGKSNANELIKKIEEVSKDKHIQLMVEEIFAEADLDESGTIDISEFCQFVRKRPETLRSINQLVETFSLTQNQDSRLMHNSV
eukprot:TRINITY_DN859_c1_g1_i1.p1 TRINITY_DN859_c1_g1~~TRINITY_DN859_c1_g1_i1.p1  ORF type:complete len:287 (-),score=65.92 TRINITY_DN859_c1_g1_i1:286-1146(-)